MLKSELRTLTPRLSIMFAMSFKCFNEFDKIYTRFSKYVLGVHSKACNFALHSELGQVPLILSVIVGVINFWLHILQSGYDNLISEAYREHLNSRSLKSPWICFAKSILMDLGFSHVWDNQGAFNSLVVCIKAKLKETFISFWKRCSNSDVGMDKLRTYKLIKRTFEIEKYLEILPDRKQRKSLSAFRISAHKLQTKRGRYMGKTIGEHLCTSCNKVEDEIHFVCKCVKYQSFRSNMYLNIGNSFSAPIPNEEKFFNIMTSAEEKVVKSLGMFVSSCNNISKHESCGSRCTLLFSFFILYFLSHLFIN